MGEFGEEREEGPTGNECDESWMPRMQCKIRLANMPASRDCLEASPCVALLDDELKDPNRTCVAPASSLLAYARYAGMTRYMRGKLDKYVMARVSQPFDHPFGLAFSSWMTRSPYVPEAGRPVLSFRRPSPR